MKTYNSFSELANASCPNSFVTATCNRLNTTNAAVPSESMREYTNKDLSQAYSGIKEAASDLADFEDAISGGILRDLLPNLEECQSKIKDGSFTAEDIQRTLALWAEYEASMDKQSSNTHEQETYIKRTSDGLYRMSKLLRSAQKTLKAYQEVLAKLENF